MGRLTELPKPSPDKNLYDSIRKKGLTTYPERESNYQQYQASARSAILDYQPIMLDVENVSRCNYRCTMCQMSEWPGGKRAEDMQLNDFKNLLDTQHGLVEIKLQGVGEPLLGKEDYFAMIRYARSKHLWVRSSTNASLLHLNENFKKLIDSDICEIQVSMDGTREETYQAIRAGGQFAKVSENCIQLNKYCQQVNHQRTRMWVVVQEANFGELEEFPALAARLGFKRLTLSLDLNDWGQDHWRERNDRIDTHNRFSMEAAEKLVTVGNKLGVEVTFWFIDEKFDLSTPDKLCPWPFQRAYISSDMRVVPCCMMANPEVMDLGDAREFDQAWNGTEMMEFRQMHLNGNIPRVCQTCYME